MNVGSTALKSVDAALHQLGMRMLDVDDVSDNGPLVADGRPMLTNARPRVYRARVGSDRDGYRSVAVRISDPAEAGVRNAQHALARDWRAVGARIVAPLHDELIATDAGNVSVWPWIDYPKRSLVPARRWGALLGNLHETGAGLLVPSAQPLALIKMKDVGLDAAVNDIHHPLHREPEVVESYREAVRGAIADVSSLQPTWVTCIHNDYSPGNVLDVPGNGPMTYGVELAGRAPNAVDFGIMGVGCRRYGWPLDRMYEFVTGYGERAPTQEEIDAWTRISELSAVGFAMLHADKSPADLAEYRKRIAVIRDPAVRTATWVHTGGLNTMKRDYRITGDGIVRDQGAGRSIADGHGASVPRDT